MSITFFYGNSEIEQILSQQLGPEKSDVLLYGALASIFEYASGTAQSGMVYSGVGRVLLVAGVGFKPTTFRVYG